MTPPCWITRCIARHFSTAVEQRGLLNDPDYGQFFPFVIRRDIYGETVIPENLGDITTADDSPKLAKEEQEVDRMIAKARALRVLREVTVGAFVHPYVDIRLIDRLARGLKAAGFTFINLNKEQNTVQFDDKLIATGAVRASFTCTTSISTNSSSIRRGTCSGIMYRQRRSPVR